MRKRLLLKVASLVFFAPLLQAQAPPAPPPLASVKIDNVRFEKVSKLSAAQERELAKEVRQDTKWPVARTLHVIADAVRQKVSAAYADNGYWRARITVRVIPQQLLASGQIVDVVVWASDEGPQYRLRTLSWSGAVAFPEEQLSGLVPLRPGAVLERGKLAAGMEAARRLYAAHGYINYAAVPEMQTDDAHGTASLQINVNEGGVFTFERFDVVGINATTRERLLEAWPLRPGDVYASGVVEDFVRQHASLLPPAGERDIVCRTLDLSNHTIEFTLDFRPQPIPCAGSSEAEITSQSLNRLLPEPQP